MNNIFKIVLLLIAAPTVFTQSDDLCAIEQVRVLQDAQACNPGHGYSLFQIEPTFKKVAVGHVSKYQLRRYIRNTCRAAFNDTQCTRNVRVAPECQHLPDIQLFSNYVIIMTTQVEYLCSVPPGQSHVRYLDWVKTDGPYCSAANQAIDFCINSGKEKLGLTDQNNSLTANICTLIQIQNECSSIYRMCKNKKVFQYMTEFSQILSELYNC